VDGVLRATWRIDRDAKRRATLVIRPYPGLSRAEHEEVSAEAQRTIDFAAADADARDIRIEAPVS
jgi:hypothetical protein